MQEKRETEHNDQRNTNPVIRFFSKPAVGIIGSLASILGVLVAIYFYTEGHNFRELTYYVHPAKAIVARVGQTSRLSVKLNNNPLNSDITAAQLAFWNAGELSIKSENVLKPLNISIGSKTPIIDAIIRKKSRDVVDISLDKSDFERGELRLTWNILEKNDGAIIQVIFVGNSDTPIIASATIEGQKDISRLEYSKIIRSPSEQYDWLVRKEKRSAYVILGMGVFLAVLVTILLVLARDYRRWHLLDLALIGQPVIFIFMAIYRLIKSVPPGPPFGF